MYDYNLIIMFPWYYINCWLAETINEVFNSFWVLTCIYKRGYHNVYYVQICIVLAVELTDCINEIWLQIFCD